MKTRIFASLIITGITGVLAVSAAQADAGNTVEDINASYLNPSFTRNADVSSYVTSIQEKQNGQKVVLVSITSKYDLDPTGFVRSN